MNAKEWVADYAQRLGVTAPTTEEFKVILELAGEAAHASERVAAPVACWVAAQAGVELEEALRAAREVAAEGAGADAAEGAGKVAGEQTSAQRSEETSAQRSGQTSAQRGEQTSAQRGERTREVTGEVVWERAPDG